MKSFFYRTCIKCRVKKPLKKFKKSNGAKTKDNPVSYCQDCFDKKYKHKKNSLPKEKWKPITEFNGKYEISNLGRVRNNTGKLMKLYINDAGYWVVALKKDKKTCFRRIHRLIAIAFIPNPENKLEVNHIDSDRSNYAISNLEWCSSSENHIHAAHRKEFGFLNALKPIACYNINGRLENLFNSQSEAARILKCRQSNICQALKGKQIKAKGFIWKYL